MSKIEMNINGITGTCLLDITKLKDEILFTMKDINFIHLPINCPPLVDTVIAGKNVISSISMYEDIVIDSTDFCLNADSDVVSKVNSIEMLDLGNII